MYTASNITESIFDISYVGDPNVVSFTKRLQRFRSLNPDGVNTYPTKMQVKREYMLLCYNNSQVSLLADPLANKIPNAAGPTLLASLFSSGTTTGQARDAILIPASSSNDAIAIIWSYGTGTVTTNFSLSIVYLSKSTTTSTPSYTNVQSLNLWGISLDFDIIRAVSMTNGSVVVGLGSTRYGVNNHIKALHFIKTASNIFTFDCEVHILPGMHRSLGSWSLAHNGGARAVFVAVPLDHQGLLVAQWDLSRVNTYFNSSMTTVAGPGLARTPTFSWVQCDNRGTNLPTVYCFCRGEGVMAYWIELNLNTTRISNPILQATGKSEIQLPMGFDLKKVESNKASDTFFILLQRTGPISNLWTNQRRVLQSSEGIPVNLKIESISNCNNVLFVYKPSVSKKSFAGFSCSDFQGMPLIDISMETDGTTDYIYYTTPIASDKVMIFTLGSYTVKLLKQVADPTQFKFAFIGLGGTTSGVNGSVNLTSYLLPIPPVVPTPPNYLLYYILAGLLVLLLLALCVWRIRACIIAKGEEKVYDGGYKKTQNEDGHLNKDGGILKKRLGKQAKSSQ